MSAPKLLLIGPATDRMLHRMAEVFELQHMPEDRQALAAEDRAMIGYIYVNGHGGVSADLIRSLPKLRIISNYGVGYDTVDVGTAVERGIVVTHTPDVLNDDVANTAILLMLATSRNFLADNTYIRAGRWSVDGDAPLSSAIRGKKVGILGLGRIGMAIAEKLAVFGVGIAYHNRNRRNVPYSYFGNLIEMARDCDILICAAPGGKATRHMINRSVIEALGPGGILINVGRGSIVDEPELIAALKDRRLGKAGLDVFANEPEVSPELLALDNATLLPHVASGTLETRDAMGELAVNNLIQFHATGQAVRPVPECGAMRSRPM